MLAALGLMVQAAISLHVVEAHEVPSEVRARIVAALCAGLTEHTTEAVICDRAPAPGEDQVAVRLYAGATRVLVRCDAFVGPSSQSGSVELILGGRESWRDRVQGLWSLILPRAPAAPLSAAPAPRETPWAPWALGGGSVASGALAALFLGLALDAQHELEAAQRPPAEEAALLTRIDVHRGLAVGLVATAVAAAVGAIVVASWGD